MKRLIIKTGLYETFDLEKRLAVESLGDVLRSTVLIHLFNDADWMITSKSKRLLEGSRIVYSFDAHQYDWVLNLENDEAIFPNLHKNSFGFISKNTLKLTTGEIISLNEFLDIHKKSNWPEKLFMLVGHKWNKQRPVLKSIEGQTCWDIGLNWQVGPKWPKKDWGKENWNQVFKMLESEFSLSWQQGFDDLEIYIDWIKKSKILLSHDSLGTHIAHALNIPVVALFGPTLPKEIPRYKNDFFLQFDSETPLTAETVEGILKELLLRRMNESTVRWE